MSHTNSSPGDERRPVEIYGLVRRMGRTSGYIDCPFCGTTVEVFLWSLAGSGKRCSCGALLCNGTAFKAPSSPPETGPHI